MRFFTDGRGFFQCDAFFVTSPPQKMGEPVEISPKKNGGKDMRWFSFLGHSQLTSQGVSEGREVTLQNRTVLSILWLSMNLAFSHSKRIWYCRVCIVVVSSLLMTNLSVPPPAFLNALSHFYCPRTVTSTALEPCPKGSLATGFI